MFFKKLAQKFIHIGKKETTERSQLKPFAQELREDVVSYRKNYQQPDSPALSTITSVEEFSRAYKTLQLSSLISSCFIFFIISTYFFVDGIVALISSFAFTVVGFMWHFSFVVRAYRSRELYMSWDRRTDSYSVSLSEVWDSIIEDPLSFFPFIRPLPDDDKSELGNNKSE